MHIGTHFQITGRALLQWFKAQCYDSLAVAVLWLIGLLILGVPWAPFWAILAGLFQFIPHIGPLLGLLGPAAAVMLSKGSLMPGLYVLILYAIIVVIDGFVLQPYIMRRTARVPVWASIVVPIVLGIFFNFWGVLVAAPLLAVLFAYKARYQESRRSAVEVLPPRPTADEVAPKEPPPLIER